MFFAEDTVFQMDHKKKNVLVGVERANAFAFDCTVLFLVSLLLGSKRGFIRILNSGSLWTGFVHITAVGTVILRGRQLK